MYSDPNVCTNGEGDYFLVTSTFTYFPSVPIFSQQRLGELETDRACVEPCFAISEYGRTESEWRYFCSAISYNPYNKTYYMVTTNVGAGNFFVKTQDPFGEWSEPVMLPEVGGIDPSFF